jgi:glycosyltransferase involved in cell wall biosynthesis
MYNKLKLFYKFTKLRSQLKEQNKVIDYALEQDKKYILIIDDKIPEYDKDSGSRRLTEIIKLLLKNGYGVCLMPNVKEYKFKKDYVQHFTDMGVVVYEPALNASGELITKEKFLDLVIPHITHAWLHRPNIFQKYFPILQKKGFNGPCIFDMVDFHYLRMKREAELTGDAAKLKDAEKHLKVEMGNCEKADKIIVISGKDKEALLNYYNDASKMEVVGNIHQFKNKPADFKGFTERQGLLFIGGFDHKPNEDAVVFLHEKVMPLVWNTNPDINVNIVGSNPTDIVTALHSEKFNIIGFVEDVMPYFNDAKLFVAPLRYGAGIKGKIGQSLEYSLPLVTTSIGAEGFDFGSFVDAMIADDAEGLAQKILAAYTNEELWNGISNNSENVIAPFSIQQVERNIIKVLG